MKNIRLTKIMPIIHDLALHFDSLKLDWIEREWNGTADMLAKTAASSFLKVSSK